MEVVYKTLPKPNLLVFRLEDDFSSISSFGYLVNKYPRVVELNNPSLENLSEEEDELCALSPYNQIEDNEKYPNLPKLIEMFYEEKLENKIYISSTWYGDNRFWGVDVITGLVYPYEIDTFGLKLTDIVCIQSL